MVVAVAWPAKAVAVKSQGSVVQVVVATYMVVQRSVSKVQIAYIVRALRFAFYMLKPFAQWSFEKLSRSIGDLLSTSVNSSRWSDQKLTFWSKTSPFYSSQNRAIHYSLLSFVPVRPDRIEYRIMPLWSASASAIYASLVLTNKPFRSFPWRAATAVVDFCVVKTERLFRCFFYFSFIA